MMGLMDTKQNVFKMHHCYHYQAYNGQRFTHFYHGSCKWATFKYLKAYLLRFTPIHGEVFNTASPKQVQQQLFSTHDHQWNNHHTQQRLKEFLHTQWKKSKGNTALPKQVQQQLSLTTTKQPPYILRI